MVRNLRVYSTFKRSAALNEMIKKNLKKVSQVYDRITYTRIYLRKKKKETEEDNVIIQIGLEDQQVVISEKSCQFEKSLKTAFENLKQRIKEYKSE